MSNQVEVTIMGQSYLLARPGARRRRTASGKMTSFRRESPP